MSQQAENIGLREIDTGLEGERKYSNSDIVISENRRKMRILMVEPKTPASFWSHGHTLPLIGKKAAFAPLGLMTLGGMLPKEWDLQLADLNTGEIALEDIQKADAVFVGGMHIQAESFHEQVQRAKATGKTVVGGGPYVTSSPEECHDLDHMVLGEVEGGIEEWTRQFELGEAPKIATMPQFPNLTHPHLPRYDLINPQDYFSMSTQLSRGCPHNCEFCSVTKLNGRNPRLKPIDKLLAEVEAIRQSGFRGSTFVVDDNFIGRWKQVEEMLPRLAEWQKKHGYPLDFFTQTSLKLAEHDTLMERMVEAGFSGVFLGIETPSKKALRATKKYQNVSLDLDESVRKIACAGLEPMGGFIMGLAGDEDPEEIADFINASPIPTAMVGIVQAIPQTDLYERMKKEGRLLQAYNGDLQGYNGDQFGMANFRTEIDPEELREKYVRVLTSIYDPKNYFQRCLHLMRLRKSPKHSLYRHRLAFGINAFKNSVIQQGIIAEYRAEYWKFLGKVTTEMTDKIHSAVTYAAKLHHYYKYTHENVLPRLAK